MGLDTRFDIPRTDPDPKSKPKLNVKSDGAGKLNSGVRGTNSEENVRHSPPHPSTACSSDSDSPT